MKLELKFVPSLTFPVIFYFPHYILFSALCYEYLINNGTLIQSKLEAIDKESKSMLKVQLDDHYLYVTLNHKFKKSFRFGRLLKLEKF